MSKKDEGAVLTERARPVTVHETKELQHYGPVARLPIALDASICAASAGNLNQLLADTMTLRDLYKKHHWQVSGPTFYQLHLLFDKHFNEQSELVDAIAERIQSLGGVSIAMAHDVAEMTLIPRPPRGRDEVPVQISRLLHAHEVVLKEARAMARQAAEAGGGGTHALGGSEGIRVNGGQGWVGAAHLVGTPLGARGARPQRAPGLDRPHPVVYVAIVTRARDPRSVRAEDGRRTWGSRVSCPIEGDLGM